MMMLMMMMASMRMIEVKRLSFCGKYDSMISVRQELVGMGWKIGFGFD